MYKILFFIVFCVVAIYFYISSDNNINKTDFNKKNEKKLKNNKDVQIIFKESKKKIQVTKSDKKYNIDQELKNIVEDGYVVSSKKVGKYTLDIVSDVKIEKEEYVPPSVPVIISGKIAGHKYTQTIDRTQAQRGFYVVVKDENSQTVAIKEIEAVDLENSIGVTLPLLDEEENNSEGNNDESTDSVNEQESIPPNVPVF